MKKKDKDYIRMSYMTIASNVTGITYQGLLIHRGFFKFNCEQWRNKITAANIENQHMRLREARKTFEKKKPHRFILP